MSGEKMREFKSRDWTAQAEESTAVFSGERRLHERMGVKVNRLIRATLDFGKNHTREEYVYVLDFSEGGMRVNVDREFPADKPLRIQFTLQYLELDVYVKPIWQKKLTGGTWVAGLSFDTVTVDQSGQISAMMEAFSLRGRRERFRLKALVAVSLRLAGWEEWLSVLLVDMSTSGVRIRCNEVLDDHATLELKILLPDLKEVDARGEIVWQQQARPGRFEYGVRFNAIAESGVAAIQAYIDHCVGGL